MFAQQQHHSIRRLVARQDRRLIHESEYRLRLPCREINHQLRTFPRLAPLMQKLAIKHNNLAPRSRYQFDVRRQRRAKHRERPIDVVRPKNAQQVSIITAHAVAIRTDSSGQDDHNTRWGNIFTTLACQALHFTGRHNLIDIYSRNPREKWQFYKRPGKTVRYRIAIAFVQCAAPSLSNRTCTR